MSKERLLISVLKSEQNIAELRKTKYSSLGIEKNLKKIYCAKKQFFKAKNKRN